MERIKEAIQTMQKERQQIMLNHQGKILEQLQLLKKARVQGDIEAANAVMNMIQTEQQARITELNKVLENLQDLLVDIR
jgi:arginine utilization protein RocB